ncbi:MAG: flagellar biosynthetic protein FliP [Gammaproteobacteria bacterium]|nr:MAG: flagellar biosynthetic protein FliP [Gammaproteobacteria bacterium]
MNRCLGIIKKLLRLTLIISPLLLPALALADTAVSTDPVAGGGLETITVKPNADGSQTYSVNIQIIILMTVLTLLPAILLMMTSFTRIIIVLGFIRQAMGTHQTPSNQVLLGLSLFLTMFVMAPVIDRINSEALQPYMKDEIQIQDAILKARPAVTDFMLAQTRESDLELFVSLAGIEEVKSLDDVPFTVLIPAFVTSELKTAFQIGFIIFLPFLVIDLVVACTLMSMGMMMLSPMIISLPFKIMLFVLVDGWSLVIGTLAASFNFG